MSDGVLVQTGQGESFTLPLSSDPKKVKERSMLMTGKTLQVIAKALRWTELVSMHRADKGKVAQGKSCTV